MSGSSPEPSEPAWHSWTLERVLESLGSRTAGLTTAEAQTRKLDAGPNVLPEPDRESLGQRLLRQFASPLIVILGGAAALSLALGEVIDGIVIVAIVVANAGLGLIQEYRADRALQALASMLRPTVRVRRDGHLREVDAATVVPGDVVELTAGDRIPADVRWLATTNVEVDEAVLTGESVAVGKDVAGVPREAPLHERRSLGFQATDVVAGTALGVVVATGARTAFGRVAALAGDADAPPTPLQRQLATVGRQLGLLAVGLAALVGAGGWVAGHAASEMLLAAVSLAVAAVPEGLPAVVTLTLAFGVRRLAGRHVLLRRLEAAETMGAATVICTDKTGTLTEGRMVVTRVWTPEGAVQVTGSGYDPDGVFLTDEGRPTPPPPAVQRALQAALDCNHADIDGSGPEARAVGSPTEAALVVAARKAGLVRRPSREVLPFDSRAKRMAVEVEGTRLTKGAPEVVGPLCALDEAARRELDALLEGWGRQGLRTLAVAAGPDGEAELLGLLGIVDPPRPEVAQAIASAREAGIEVILVTGDALATARGIAQQIGHDGEIVARATPEDKLRLVERLQGEGHVVAMTGDGVNDAPALEQADVGVAMGIRGTDVARASSDIVLTDDHFASIVGGIEEGRRQLDNIRKFVRYLLASNTGEVLAVGFSVVTGGPLLLLPVQILWMNLITDGATALALGLEGPEPDVMRRPPEPPRSSLLPLPAIGTLLAGGIWLAIGATVSYQVAWSATGDLVTARTAAFTSLVVLEKANVLNYRGLRTPTGRLGWLGNPWLLVAIAATLLLQLGAVYLPPLQVALHTAPLRLEDLALIGLLAVPTFLGPELYKMWRA